MSLEGAHREHKSEVLFIKTSAETDEFFDQNSDEAFLHEDLQRKGWFSDLVGEESSGGCPRETGAADVCLVRWIDQDFLASGRNFVTQVPKHPAWYGALVLAVPEVELGCRP